MTQHDLDKDRPPDRRIVNALWVTAALALVTGFVMASFSTVLGHADLRRGGMTLIIAGLAVAALAWICDGKEAYRAD